MFTWPQRIFNFIPLQFNSLQKDVKKQRNPTTISHFQECLWVMRFIANWNWVWSKDVLMPKCNISPKNFKTFCYIFTAKAHRQTLPNSIKLTKVSNWIKTKVLDLCLWKVVGVCRLYQWSIIGCMSVTQNFFHRRGSTCFWVKSHSKCAA